MKKITTIFMALVLIASVANAQDYKVFKWAFGIGYAIPGGEGAGGGVLIDMEPAYRVTDDLAVGLRVQTALMVAVDLTGTGVSKVQGVKSYALTGQYYLMDGGFRPNVGLGLGLYRVVSVTAATSSASIGFDNKIGLPIRLGFEAGHFLMMFEYNLVGSSEPDVSYGSVDKVKNSYIGIKMGGFFGGGAN